METITFRCTTCQSVLKVGADKAGRSAKCTKCGTPLTIPAKSEPAKVPVPAPAPAKKTDDDDDGTGKMTFDLKDAPTAEQEIERRKKLEDAPKIQKGPGRVETKKLAKITNPEEWRKVGFGTKLIGAGLCVWLAAFLLYRLPLVVGMTVGPEYAKAADERLVINPIDSGEPPVFDLANYAVALVAGDSWAKGMIWAIRIANVLFLLQYALLLPGYFICLAAPNRFGTRLQIMVLFGLAFFNPLFTLFFRLLPMAGAYLYTILPFALPEVAMMEMNSERVESVYSFWLRSPVLEGFAAELMTIVHYLEPALIATFIATVGVAIKSDDLEGQGMLAMKFGFSQIFLQIVWLMLCLCGAPSILLWGLRFIYAFGAVLFIYQLLFSIFALFSVAAVVEEQLGDEAATAGAEDEDEEDVEEEEEEEPKPRRRGH